MRIVTLLENNISPHAAIIADTNELKNAHGLSLYLETADHRILFDMGPGDEIAHNARNLSIDLAAVDLAAISHGHYDHGGGLATFLSLNTTAPFYTTVRAFENHYSEAGWIGLDPQLEHHPQHRIAQLVDEIAPGITFFSNIENHNLPSPANDCLRDDAYLDEFTTRLIQTGATFYTGHCTGSEAYERLAIRMGGILHPCNTGDNIIV